VESTSSRETVAMECTHSPNREITESTHSPSQEITESTHSPNQEIMESTHSPNQEITESTHSSNQEIMESTHSPNQEITERRHSPNPRILESTSSIETMAMESTHSPNQEITESTHSPNPRIVESTSSRETVAMESIHSPNREISYERQSSNRVQTRRRCTILRTLPLNSEEEKDSDTNSEYIPNSTTESEGSVEIPILNVQKRNLQIKSSLVTRHSNNSFETDKSNGTFIEGTSYDETKKAKKNRKRRPCLFCGIFQTHLRRHILLKHNKEDKVKQVSKFAKEDQAACFEQMRKTGILKYNQEQLRKEKPMCERERAPHRAASEQSIEELVACGKCSGIYSKKFYGRHKRQCIGESVYSPEPLPMNLLKDCELSQDFKENILSRFKSDTIGQTCSSDSAIVNFGKRQYEKLKRKKDKPTEVRKSVMSDMRHISALFHEFRTRSNVPPNLIGSQDMLIIKNFSVLTESISAYTSTVFKISLLYLIKKFAKIQKAVSMMNDDDRSAEEIDKFLQVLSLSKTHIFGNATYTLNRNRLSELREPGQLPLEADVAKTREAATASPEATTVSSKAATDSPLVKQSTTLNMSLLTVSNDHNKKPIKGTYMFLLI